MRRPHQPFIRTVPCRNCRYAQNLVIAIGVRGIYAPGGSPPHCAVLSSKLGFSPIELTRQEVTEVADEDRDGSLLSR
jgi:hypothetical protein